MYKISTKLKATIIAATSDISLINLECVIITENVQESSVVRHLCMEGNFSSSNLKLEIPNVKS